MGTEHRSVVSVSLPEEDMAELKHAARQRGPGQTVGHEARLWLRSKAQECRAARIAAEEDLWVEPDPPALNPSPPTNRPWEN